MKLMLLIIPTIHSDGEADRERLGEADDARARTGWRGTRSSTPERDRERGQPELAGELPAGPQVEVVVEDAERGGERAADEQRDELVGSIVRRRRQEVELAVRQAEQRRATTMNAVATATPPPRGIGTTLTRRWSGWSTASTRSATRRTSGVRKNEISAAATKAPIRYGSAGPVRSVNLTRPARPPPSGRSRPGTGKRAVISATRAASRACAAGSPRCSIASMIRSPIARISAAPMPRDVTAGRADPDPGRRVRRAACRTGSGSC